MVDKMFHNYNKQEAPLKGKNKLIVQGRFYGRKVTGDTPPSQRFDTVPSPQRPKRNF